MSAVPGSLDTDQQPPMTVPLRHFLVGLGFLLGGVAIGIGLVVDAVPGLGTLAHVHLLLAGWACLTIMGAMTQFVPVWSGVTLYSQRLASAQLVLVTAGLVGFSVAFVLGTLAAVAVFGAVMLAGFWTFVYNIARTLWTVDSYDVTERHFLFALGCFLLVTIAGLVLAVNLTYPVLGSLPVGHVTLRGTHVTLAIFGAIMTTVYGALYQLVTMFTQTDLHGIDHHLQTLEELGHPAGVLLLAAGRLTNTSVAARVGGVLVLVGAVAVGLVLLRKLYEMQVEWTPMHSRYAVLGPALLLWGVTSLPAWVRQPTAAEYTFGAAGAVHLLVLGVVGFVLVGTLYHIIPFIVWVHQYSDRLGLEEVPMIDDLYSDRLAATDFILLLSGTSLLVVSDIAVSNTLLAASGGLLVTGGVLCFTANMVLVIYNHSPQSLDSVLLGAASPRRGQSGG